MFKALSRANREMQLESWTPVTITMGTMFHLFDQEREDMATPLDDLKSTSVLLFLETWCKAHIKQGFAVKREPASLTSFTQVGKDDNSACLIFLFKLSSEAVRFKMTWGGR